MAAPTSQPLAPNAGPTAGASITAFLGKGVVSQARDDVHAGGGAMRNDRMTLLCDVSELLVKADDKISISKRTSGKEPNLDYLHVEVQPDSGGEPSYLHHLLFGLKNKNKLGARLVDRVLRMSDTDVRARYPDLQPSPIGKHDPEDLLDRIDASAVHSSLKIRAVDQFMTPPTDGGYGNCIPIAHECALSFDDEEGTVVSIMFPCTDREENSANLNASIDFTTPAAGKVAMRIIPERPRAESEDETVIMCTFDAPQILINRLFDITGPAAPLLESALNVQWPWVAQRLKTAPNPRYTKQLPPEAVAMVVPTKVTQALADIFTRRVRLQNVLNAATRLRKPPEEPKEQSQAQSQAQSQEGESSDGQVEEEPIEEPNGLFKKRGRSKSHPRKSKRTKGENTEHAEDSEVDGVEEAAEETDVDDIDVNSDDAVANTENSCDKTCLPCDWKTIALEPAVLRELSPQYYANGEARGQGMRLRAQIHASQKRCICALFRNAAERAAMDAAMQKDGAQEDSEHALFIDIYSCGRVVNPFMKKNVCPLHCSHSESYAGRCVKDTWVRLSCKHGKVEGVDHQLMLDYDEVRMFRAVMAGALEARALMRTADAQATSATSFSEELLKITGRMNCMIEEAAANMDERHGRRTNVSTLQAVHLQGRMEHQDTLVADELASLRTRSRHQKVERNWHGEYDVPRDTKNGKLRFKPYTYLNSHKLPTLRRMNKRGTRYTRIPASVAGRNAMEAVHARMFPHQSSQPVVDQNY